MNDEISKRCLSTDDIYDIIDGEATEELVSYFEEHIKSCEKCRAEYENIKKLKGALRDYTSAPSADFTKNTLARMKTVERNPFIRITGSKAFKTTAALAACLVLVFAVCGRGLIDRIATSQNKTDEKLNTVSAANDYSLKNGDAEAYSEDDATETKSFNVENSAVGKPDSTEIVEEPAFSEEPVAPVAPMVPEAPVAPVAPEEPVMHPVAPPVPGDYIPSDSYIDPNEANIPSVPMPEVPEDYVPTPPTYPDGSTIPSVEWVDPPAAGNIPTTECPAPPTPVAPMAPEMPTPVDPTASNSVVVENPLASDAGTPVPENPLADDAYASVVENPDLIYLPTALQDKLTVIYSVNANGNYTILTAENINLSIHTDSIGESLYNDIQRRYALSQGIETPDIIETPSNVPATEVTEGPVPVEPETESADSENVAEEPTEAVEEEIRVTPVKPTTPVENIELVDGFYITVPNSYNFRIQWYENGMFYNLELPMEYYGSDYSELTKIELVENPMK